MSWSLIAHQCDNLGASGGTGTAFNSTGANLIVVAASYNNGGSSISAPTDSAGNAWTLYDGPRTAAVYEEMKVWYCVNPTTSATHTVSFGGALSACAINVSCWNGASVSPADQHIGAATTGVSSMTGGSLTPGAANALVISFCTVADTNTGSTTASGFTPSGLDSTWQTPGVSFQNNGISQAYQIQTTATAVNPTWTCAAATAMTVINVSFLAAPPVTPTPYVSEPQYPPMGFRNPQAFNRSFRVYPDGPPQITVPKSPIPPVLPERIQPPLPAQFYTHYSQGAVKPVPPPDPTQIPIGAQGRPDFYTYPERRAALERTARHETPFTAQTIIRSPWPIPSVTPERYAFRSDFPFLDRSRTDFPSGPPVQQVIIPKDPVPPVHPERFAFRRDAPWADVTQSTNQLRPTNLGVWINVTPGGITLDPNFTGPSNNFGTLDVLLDPVNPNVIWAFACYQGAWKSTDYGQTFNKVSTDGKLEVGRPAGELDKNPFRSPSTFPRIYACAVFGGLGSFVSTDGGSTWTNNTSITPNSDLGQIDTDPYDGLHALAGNHSDNHVYETTDGGVTWTDKGVVTDGTNTADASAWAYFTGKDRNTWIVVSSPISGTTGGIYRTTNAGASWTLVSNAGHDHGSLQPLIILTGVIYLPTGAFSGGLSGIIKSTDFGATWVQINNSSATVVVASDKYLYAMRAFASNGTYFSNPQRALRTNDTTWDTTSIFSTIPTGMINGPKKMVATYDGQNWIIVAGCWNGGLWRYVEPADPNAALVSQRENITPDQRIVAPPVLDRSANFMPTFVAVQPLTPTPQTPQVQRLTPWNPERSVEAQPVLTPVVILPTTVISPERLRPAESFIDRNQSPRPPASGAVIPVNPIPATTPERQPEPLHPDRSFISVAPFQPPSVPVIPMFTSAPLPRAVQQPERSANPTAVGQGAVVPVSPIPSVTPERLPEPLRIDRSAFTTAPQQSIASPVVGSVGTPERQPEPLRIDRSAVASAPLQPVNPPIVPSTPERQHQPRTLDRTQFPANYIQPIPAPIVGNVSTPQRLVVHPPFAKTDIFSFFFYSVLPPTVRGIPFALMKVMRSIHLVKPSRSGTLTKESRSATLRKRG